MSLEAIAVAGATVDYMESELNGELERRAQGARIVSMSHAVTAGADTSSGQLYSVTVILEK